MGRIRQFDPETSNRSLTGVVLVRKEPDHEEDEEEEDEEGDNEEADDDDPEGDEGYSE